ncbi:preprotein translocase subunit SecG [Candidatus Uhrbacteria bacterium]|nr:preprotein translocase subunit SecG [Candidatus Uhrbacteria bacterium]
MIKLLGVFQIVSAVLVIISILLQQQGSGLGGAFGGEGNVFRTRRGVERILFISTIVFAVLFFGAAIASLFVSR